MKEKLEQGVSFLLLSCFGPLSINLLAVVCMCFQVTARLLFKYLLHRLLRAIGLLMASP